MPLSTTGICTQILGSLATFRQHGSLQTENDCKAVLNHLIRFFSEPLGRSGKQVYFRSALITAEYKGETIKDHVVPVREIMTCLFQWPDKEISTESVIELERWLTNKLIIAEITTEEDAALNGCGRQSTMPNGWGSESCQHDSHPWARYMEAGIYENFKHQLLN